MNTSSAIQTQPSLMTQSGTPVAQAPSLAQAGLQAQAARPAKLGFMAAIRASNPADPLTVQAGRIRIGATELPNALPVKLLGHIVRAGHDLNGANACEILQSDVLMRMSPKHDGQGNPLFGLRNIHGKAIPPKSLLTETRNRLQAAHDASNFQTRCRVIRTRRGHLLAVLENGSSYPIEGLSRNLVKQNAYYPCSLQTRSGRGGGEYHVVVPLHFSDAAKTLQASQASLQAEYDASPEKLRCLVQRNTEDQLYARLEDGRTFNLDQYTAGLVTVGSYYPCLIQRHAVPGSRGTQHRMVAVALFGADEDATMKASHDSLKAEHAKQDQKLQCVIERHAKGFLLARLSDRRTMRLDAYTASLVKVGATYDCLVQQRPRPGSRGKSTMLVAVPLTYEDEAHAVTPARRAMTPMDAAKAQQEAQRQQALLEDQQLKAVMAGGRIELGNLGNFALAPELSA
jgi:hypothetical protein